MPSWSPQPSASGGPSGVSAPDRLSASSALSCGLARDSSSQVTGAGGGSSESEMVPAAVPRVQQDRRLEKSVRRPQESRTGNQKTTLCPLPLALRQLLRLL